jgi:hypothetical protein
MGPARLVTKARLPQCGIHVNPLLTHRGIDLPGSGSQRAAPYAAGPGSWRSCIGPGRGQHVPAGGTPPRATPAGAWARVLLRAAPVPARRQIPGSELRWLAFTVAVLGHSGPHPFHPSPANGLFAQLLACLALRVAVLGHAGRGPPLSLGGHAPGPASCQAWPLRPATPLPVSGLVPAEDMARHCCVPAIQGVLGGCRQVALVRGCAAGGCASRPGVLRGRRRGRRGRGGRSALRGAAAGRRPAGRATAAGPVAPGRGGRARRAR